MSRGSRFRTLLFVLGTILTAAPAGAEDKPGTPSTETKSAGQWTDPPAKVNTPAMNAAAAKPVAAPAKVDEPKISEPKISEPKVSARSEARPARGAAGVRRERIRTAASRTRPIRQARMEMSRKAERQPSRRVVARMLPPRTVRVTGRSLSPVYGYIAPDAPASAYYEYRRIGTVGTRPGDLGLPSEGGQAFRNVGMRGDGHLVMRWRGPGVPTGLVIDRPSPLD